MGVTYQDVIAYTRAKYGGTSFKRTMTLGHQDLYLHKSELKALSSHHFAVTGGAPDCLANYRWGDYADNYLRECLGVTDLTVIDASEYEGADTIHDMNQPIPDTLRDQFDVVIDCGSLEHIFNVPVALKNLAAMVKVGGTIFITTPANNLMGHGFYQFSPELMFRVFSEENGFELRRVALVEAAFPSVELTRNNKVYRVTDPQDVHKRVGLQSKRPTMMMVEALKVNDVEMFATPPFQSDYVSAWTATEPVKSRSPMRQLAKGALDALPRGVRGQLVGLKQKRTFSLKNDRYFRREPQDREIL
ncbi:class I SAM-dependent methyltransferase [Mycolicibacterium gilvum]|uniref:Methyltransferase family protein n=1 Tax=Mycolicibacterium gilvum (strain DSM 45189 / LMG 24558 / Spyr1) TaxID=278137 RepID=E6TAS8_MYCSR|nr:methyltransferase domain-containing protein [Mycolicibacterium gilvum]ADU00728.1 methyltransferase family protein [Mycolicibacterium gilvum Spyr1]